MTPQAPLARRVLTLLDLTSLNETDTEVDITTLCHQAKSPQGQVAAVCVFPTFVATARQTLSAIGADDVNIATVVNFPTGDEPIEQVIAQTQQAVVAGADEIDVVMPYRALQQGDETLPVKLVRACKAVCGDQVLLKVIIESGELKEPALIRLATKLAIAGGADFVKTSTGKVKVNATLEAAKIMLETIQSSGMPVGFKAAGGVRQLSEAQAYVELAETIMGPDWVTPDHFRFGASSLLGDLLKALDTDAPAPQGEY